MTLEVFLQQIDAHLQTFDQLFFPLKLETELLHHTESVACFPLLVSTSLQYPKSQTLGVGTNKYIIDPFLPTTPLAHYLPMLLLGVKLRPEIWRLSIIAEVFQVTSNLHLSTYKHLLLITGRLVCQWQHLESCLCPPPLSAQHTRRHVQVGADCQLRFSSHKLPYSCTLLVFLLPFPLQSSFFSL